MFIHTPTVKQSKTPSSNLSRLFTETFQRTHNTHVCRKIKHSPVNKRLYSFETSVTVRTKKPFIPLNYNKSYHRMACDNGWCWIYYWHKLKQPYRTIVHIEFILIWIFLYTRAITNTFYPSVFCSQTDADSYVVLKYQSQITAYLRYRE